MTAHYAVAPRPAYSVTKMAGTMLFQLIAQDLPPKKVQVVTYHPGLVYGDGWKAMGLTAELFDNGE